MNQHEGRQIQTKGFDTFVCIADQCPLTCCKGWAVRADGGIYEKWQEKEETAYLCDKTVLIPPEETQESTAEESEAGPLYQMKMDSNKCCVMLDEKGLCEIVKRHGDACLSDTCAQFPRRHNILRQETDGKETCTIAEEYSLSGACPAAAEFVWQLGEDKILQAGWEEGISFPLEYQVRNALIGLLQNRAYSLDIRLLQAFALLQECLDCEWEDEVNTCLERWQETALLQEKALLWQQQKAAGREALEAFREVCMTWIDVTMYYKEEAMYRPYLKTAAEYADAVEAQEQDQQEVLRDWEAWKLSWSTYDTFWENLLVGEIFSDCISDDFGYLAECFQNIMMEYCMTRMTAFLQVQATGEKLTRQTLIQTAALMLRMIGHNTAGMTEYWEESFDDSIVTLEYAFLLLQ